MSNPAGFVVRAERPPLHGVLHFARPGTLSPGLLRLLTLALSAGGLALMLISLNPYSSASLINESGSDSGGNVINQVGFLGAGMIFLLALMCFASRRVLASLLSPGIILLMVVLAYSLIKAPYPEFVLRGLVLTVIGMLIAFAVIVLPRSQRDLETAILLGTGAALALSYGGLVLFPDLAMHGYDAFEPQHAGLWRGHFSHKNLAGPVMCVIAIMGLYLMRSSYRFLGFVIFAAGALFVLKTGSKTTSGFFPLSIMIVMMASLFGRPAAAISTLVAAVASVAVLTIGTLYSPALSDLIGSLLGDETYTGRTTLWEFSLSKIPEKPWLGFGLYNFWNTDTVFQLDKPFEAAWDYRLIVHGHNNYLDIPLNLGLIGGGVLYWLLYVGPMFNYAKARRIPANRKIADMFFMMIVFFALLSFLETFFLARNDPMWLMHVFAVFGLHLTARFEMNHLSLRQA